MLYAMTEEDFKMLKHDCGLTAERVKDIKFWLEGDEKRGFVGLMDRMTDADKEIKKMGKEFTDFKTQHLKLMEKLKTIAYTVAVCLVIIAICLGYISISDAAKFIPFVK